MIRKILGARLAGMEFHDKADNFQDDVFFDQVSPIVLGITGTPESCSDEELPGRCMVMAKDIVKKRRQYQKRKRSSNDKKTKKSPSKRSRILKPTTKPPPRPAVARRRKLVLPPRKDVDVDALFEVEDDDATTSFNCRSCEVSIALPDCFPEENRKDKKNLYCKKCFDKNNKVLDCIDLSTAQDKESKMPAERKVGKKGGKKGGIKKNKKVTQRLKVGDYVMAQFPGFGDEWFRAEVYSKFQSKFHVYFLEDGSHLKNVEAKSLKRADAGEEWTKMSRKDFLNKEFCSADGKKYIAVELGRRQRLNKYACKLVGSSEKAKPVWLGVSEVQKLISKQSSS